MYIKINYKKNLLNKKTANIVLFSDEKFNLSSLKNTYAKSIIYKEKC